MRSYKDGVCRKAGQVRLYFPHFIACGEMVLKPEVKKFLEIKYSFH